MKEHGDVQIFIHTKNSLKLSKTVKDSVDTATIAREEWKTFVHGSQLFICKIDLNMSFIYKKWEKLNIYIIRSNLRKCIHLTGSIVYTCVGWSAFPRGLEWDNILINWQTNFLSDLSIGVNLEKFNNCIQGLFFSIIFLFMFRKN